MSVRVTIPADDPVCGWTVGGVTYALVPFVCRSDGEEVQLDQGYAVVGRTDSGDLTVVGNITAGDAGRAYNHERIAGLARISLMSFPEDQVTAHEEQGDPDHLGTSRSAWSLVGGEVVRVSHDIVTANVPPFDFTADPPDTKRPVGNFAVFRSPAGNIRCQIFEDWVLCSIEGAEWEAPVPDPQRNCMDPHPEGVYSNMLALGVTGPSVLCQNGVALDADEGTTSWSDSWDGDSRNFPVLGYGESLTVNDIVCSVAETGVSCENAAGSFLISKYEYKLVDLN